MKSSVVASGEKVLKRTYSLGKGPWTTSDPFLFCVHHLDLYPAGEENMGPDTKLLARRNIGSDYSYEDGWSMYHGDSIPGFPQHPHRGFETITIAKQGLIDHTDSAGNTARFGLGDTQWLTAGKGIQHSEMFPLVHRDKPNTMELFQIWLNLPKSNKMCEPHFKMLWGEDTPIAEVPDENGKVTNVTVVAGGIAGEKPISPPPDSYASFPDADIGVWVLAIPAGGVFTIPPTDDERTTRNMFVYEGGDIHVDGAKLPVRFGGELKSSVPARLEARGDASSVLVLQGRPIGEPVVQHGPFVMNTQEEIRQCFADFQRTHFGGWPAGKKPDNAHSRDTERHANQDGQIVKPPSVHKK